MTRVDRAQRQENEGKQEENVHESLVDSEVECVLRLHVGRDTNPGTHNTPTVSEVAAIIIDANAAQPRDIILYTRQGGFNRTYETDPHYDSLQYPLLHPYGESGWTHKMPYTGELNNVNNDQGGRPRAKAEQERLRYIENNQIEFRLETIQGLTDAYRQEGTEAHLIAAVHGVEQYARNSTSIRGYRQNTSEEEIGIDANNIGDAIAIVRELGEPNLFITMACNPKWVEIQKTSATDRLLRIDQTEGVLGIQAARIHVVGYPKRSLPHTHILLIVRPDDKPLTAQEADRLVSTEIRDKEKQPYLYETVITWTLHGPCRDANKNSPSMKNGKCSKTFPKPLGNRTTMAADKYIV
ncbi:Helitron helicase-like protein [Phytophthora palmivora]|uniref:Helitron helicase-like protein n=1 Tax=Phytophthora palmivora TaxID=4796 RepID=A0A2P4XEM4_9STRA|nr:Helitron helicase-like protein [Phytophthora palmivora]